MSEMIEGKHVLIIGGSAGIGLATARTLAGEGARVTVASRSRSRVEEAVQTIGGSVRGVTVDVTDEDDVRRLFETLGDLDHLVTPAAGASMGTVVDSPVDGARGLVESKFWGQWHAVKYGAPHMSRAGSITLFSGTVSQKAMPGASAYAAVGAAVEAMTRVLALELAPVRVNTVVPGVIDTPAWDALMGEEEKRGFLESVAGMLPVGRVGRPEDVADAVRFVIGNGFVNGTTVVVDGGHRLT